MSERVLIPEKVYAKGEPVFQSTSEFDFQLTNGDEASMAAAAQSSKARAIVLGNDTYCGPLYEALAANANGKATLLARFGVGHDNVDKQLARQNGIIVTNTPGVLDDSVAEHTLWLLGGLVKKIAQQDAQLRRGHWSAEPGVELRGKTLAVIGFGQIGRRVALAAHFGFGMRAIAVGQRPAEEFEGRERRPLAEMLATWGAETYTVDLDAAIAIADVVTLHAPATPQTRHLLNRDRLHRFKPTAFLINTARGALIDEDGLYDALLSSQLRGAALDVFEHEPYRPISPGKDLRTLESVLLTPHTGSNTDEANGRMAQSVLATLRQFFDVEIGMLHRVDQL